MPAPCGLPFARPSSCGSRCTRGTRTRARTGRPPACPIQLRPGTLPRPTSTTIATRQGARRGSTRQHASRHRLWLRRQPQVLGDQVHEPVGVDLLQVEGVRGSADVLEHVPIGDQPLVAALLDRPARLSSDRVEATVRYPVHDEMVVDAERLGETGCRVPVPALLDSEALRLELDRGLAAAESCGELGDRREPDQGLQLADLVLGPGLLLHPGQAELPGALRDAPLRQPEAIADHLGTATDVPVVMPANERVLLGCEPERAAPAQAFATGQVLRTHRPLELDRPDVLDGESHAATACWRYR